MEQTQSKMAKKTSKEISKISIERHKGKSRIEAELKVPDIIVVPDRTDKELIDLLSGRVPAALFTKKKLEELNNKVISTYGLDDGEVCSILNIPFNEEVHATSYNDGGLYETFEREGYGWSDQADKWFNTKEAVPEFHAYIISQLINE